MLWCTSARPWLLLVHVEHLLRCRRLPWSDTAHSNCSDKEASQASNVHSLENSSASADRSRGGFVIRSPQSQDAWKAESQTALLRSFAEFQSLEAVESAG